MRIIPKSQSMMEPHGVPDFRQSRTTSLFVWFGGDGDMEGAERSNQTSDLPPRLVEV